MSAPVNNKYAVGNNGGRPPKYKKKQDLINSCDEYFEYIKGEFHKDGDLVIWDRHPEPATVTGLVLFLGFSHRQSLEDYQKNKVFSDIIKKARSRVEHEYEKNLHGNNNTGSIFALKNMGWRDKQEIGITDNSGQDILLGYGKEED